MIIIPAIDIRAEKCVRLRQGDFARETVYPASPLEMAHRWVRDGAQALHLVDLDGAKEGRPCNLLAIEEIARSTAVPCHAGGGVRSDADIQSLLEAGVRRVILGSKACKEPEWLARMAERFPNCLFLGLDAKSGRLATEGWQEVLPTSALELASQVSALPLAGIIFTDISRDGMLQGPSFDALAQVQQATRLPIIASGGVTTLTDIQRLRTMDLYGCIIGRGLYEQTITLSEAIRAAA